jgi:hypothetical protein
MILLTKPWTLLYNRQIEKEADMWELLLNVGSFLLGMSIGKAKALNVDIIKQTDHMQSLIDEAYESRDAMKSLLFDAEEKAETWERRYNNLLSTTQTSFEE